MAINWCSSAAAANIDMDLSGSGGVAGSTSLVSVEMTAIVAIYLDRRQWCREMLPTDRAVRGNGGSGGMMEEEEEEKEVRGGTLLDRDTVWLYQLTYPN